MANAILTSLTELISIASGDWVYIVDVSDTTDGALGTSKKILRSNFVTGLAASGANSDITSLTALSTPLSVLQGGTGVALSTGSVAVVLSTSPTLVTPILGVATATSINKVTITAPASSATLTLATGSSLITAGAFAVTLTSTGTTGVTLPTTGTLATLAGTETLSNKRNTRRVIATTQSATPTINTDNTDISYITALAQAITSMTTNLSGTPVNGDSLIISITDNGSARAITWGASFESSGTVALPTTTVLSVRLDVGFLWNTATSKWRCVAVA